MSVKGKRTIWVGPADGANCKPLIVEGLAVNSVTPGAIVERVAGGLQTTTKAATVFNSETLVAIEYGDHTGGNVDTAYEIGSNVLSGQARSGEFYNVLAASGLVLVKGTALSSNANGVLKIAATDGTEQILFYSDEIITTTAIELVCVRKA